MNRYHEPLKSLPGWETFVIMSMHFLSSMGSDAKKGKYEKYVLFITKIN